jgi:hypothetical protein
LKLVFLAYAQTWCGVELKQAEEVAVVMGIPIAEALTFTQLLYGL